MELTEADKKRLESNHQAQVREARRVQQTIIAGALLLFGVVVVWMYGNSISIPANIKQHSHWGLLIFAGLLLLIGFQSEKKTTKSGGIESDDEVRNNTFIRILIFLTFHSVIGYGMWFWLDRYVYSEGFIRGALDLTALLLVGLSAIDTFDWSLKNIEKAEVTYFGQNWFSNVGPGLVCLGLPKWLSAAMEKVEFTRDSITIGLKDKNGSRQPLVLQFKGVFVVFDIMFMISTSNTRKYLQLKKGKGIEKAWVELLNSVLFALVQGDRLDPKTRTPVLVDGKTVPYALDVEELIKLTRQIEYDLMNDTTPTGIKGLLRENGFTLHSITVKDIERESKLLANRVLEEEAEKFGIANKIDKTKMVYDAYNFVGTPKELKYGDPEYITMEKAEEYVERDGKVTTQVIKGGRGTIVDARGDK